MSEVFDMVEIPVFVQREAKLPDYSLVALNYKLTVYTYFK